MRALGFLDVADGASDADERMKSSPAESSPRPSVTRRGACGGALVGLLVGLTAAPPPLWAQSAASALAGATAGTPQVPTVAVSPAQASQTIVQPPPAPAIPICPVPPGPPVAAAPPAPRGAASGSSPTDASKGGGAATGVPSIDGLLGQMARQASDPFAQGGSAAGAMSVEQSFASQLLLEDSQGTLRQFGYEFFQHHGGNLQPANDLPVGADYTLGPDDVLVLHLWNVGDTGGTARSLPLLVERDGTAFVPEVGPVAISGMTFAEATRLLQGRLRRVYKRFEMHLTMARLRSIKVFVVGDVIRPGAYDLSSLSTASGALAAACGPSKSGSLRRIKLLREGKPVAELDFYRFFLEGDRSQDARLRAGDTVLVPHLGDVAAIAGPVRRPGILELRGPTRLSALLALAGGLHPSANRQRMQIFRVVPGKEREILDLNVDLDAIGAGRGGALDPQIWNGDFVRINAIKTTLENTVGIVGAVRNPGPHAFRPGMRLGELLTRDQMTEDAFWERAELVRTDPIRYTSRVIPFSPRRLLLEGVASENVVLQRLDRVVVQSQAKPPGMVTVQGEVVRPGAYTRQPKERISSVLKRAGGLTESAFPEGIVLVRESARAAHQAELNRFVSMQRQLLLSEAAALSSGAAGIVIGAGQGTAALGVTQEQLALQSQLAALGELAARSASGRVIIRASSIAALEGSPSDLVLEVGDSITVPERPQTVSVIGGVRNPAIFTYQAGLEANDYLTLAGGLTRHARKDEGYVVRANGSADLSLKSPLGVGDTIVIPERIEPETRTLPVLVTLSAIFASLATAALAIVVIDRIR